MKKLMLFLVCGVMVLCSAAQKKYIDNAKEDLKSGDLDKAKTFIDQAVTNEKTMGDADSWTLRGQIYQAIGANPKYEALSPNPDSVAVESFWKSHALKPTGNSGLILAAEQGINKMYGIFWNNAINGFKNKDYVSAYSNFGFAGQVNDLLHSIDTAFGAPMDTLALLNMSKAAYNAGLTDSTESRYSDSAVLHLEQLAQIKYKDLFVYQVLLANYLQKKNTERFMATAEVAKQVFPDNTDFAQQEMEYYRETGQMDAYLKQLEAGVQKDPGNYMLNFNLGVTYDDLANPKDSEGNSLPRPANYQDLFDKAANSYKKAVEIKPDEYGPNFNLGLLYYNRAAQYGKQMGDLGQSKKDQMRADSLSKAQNLFLGLAQPYLEKAFAELDAKPKLTGSELNIYQEAITGLKEIYARKNQTDKYNELDQKLKNADSKLN